MYDIYKELTISKGRQMKKLKQSSAKIEYEDTNDKVIL